MDRELFVQNIKLYCTKKGIKPTIACRESGVGASFLTDIKNKGHIPSVAKAQMLAEYLDCTVSDLLGESAKENNVGSDQFPSVDPHDDALLSAYHLAPSPIRAAVDGLLEPYKAQNPTASENTAG